MQIDNKFTAFWMNTATAPGTPLTGLSATIIIIDTDGNVVVDGEAMTELGRGWYMYTFAGYSATKDYVYTCNPGVTAYLDSGVTDKRLGNLDSAISDIRAGGGGVGINYGTIQKTIYNARDSIIKELDIIKENEKEIYDKVNETDSHIDIAKDQIIDNMNEVDLSPITGSIGILKAQFTKLSTYIKKKKSEEMVEKEGEYSEMLDSIESELKTLVSSKEIEIDTLRKQLQEYKDKEDGYEAMVEVLEGEIQDKKTEIEKETKENLIKTISNL